MSPHVPQSVGQFSPFEQTRSPQRQSAEQVEGFSLNAQVPSPQIPQSMGHVLGFSNGLQIASPQRVQSSGQPMGSSPGPHNPSEQ
jgi:hypothetical protein